MTADIILSLCRSFPLAMAGSVVPEPRVDTLHLANVSGNVATEA